MRAHLGEVDGAPFGVLQFVALQLSFVGAVMKMHIVGAHVFSLSRKKRPLVQGVVR